MECYTILRWPATKGSLYLKKITLKLIYGRIFLPVVQNKCPSNAKWQLGNLYVSPKSDWSCTELRAISARIITQDRKGGATKSWKSSEITVESSKTFGKTFAFFISHSINLFHLISMVNLLREASNKFLFCCFSLRGGVIKNWKIIITWGFSRAFVAMCPRTPIHRASAYQANCNVLSRR